MSAKYAISKPTGSAAEFDTLMRTFRDEGYDGVQLKTGQFAPYLHHPDEYLRRWGDDPGRASAIIVFDSLDEAGRQRLDASIRFASRVGSDRVVFCHSHGRDDVDGEARREFARILSEIGRHALDGGVRLSLHHHFGQPVMTRDDVAEFFSEADAGSIGLTVDTAHLAKSGIDDIPGFIREFAPIIDNVHLKDFADGRWQLLGSGRLDLPGIVRALHAIRYDEWVCVDEESDADLETAMRVSRAWLGENDRL